jgi:hypothetical protein
VPGACRGRRARLRRKYWNGRPGTPHQDGRTRAPPLVTVVGGRRRITPVSRIDASMYLRPTFRGPRSDHRPLEAERSRSSRRSTKKCGGSIPTSRFGAGGQQGSELNAQPRFNNALATFALLAMVLAAVSRLPATVSQQTSGINHASPSGRLRKILRMVPEGLRTAGLGLTPPRLGRLSRALERSGLFTTSRRVPTYGEW